MTDWTGRMHAETHTIKQAKAHTRPTDRLISRIQLEMVDLGVMMMWGPLTPRDSFRNANSEMDMRVLPRPISSARILTLVRAKQD